MAEVETFAFIIHPIQIKKDVARKFPLLGKILTERRNQLLSRGFSAGLFVRSGRDSLGGHGRESARLVIACPFTPPTMLSLPVETVTAKLSPAARCRGVERENPRFGRVHVGGGRRGKTIAERLDIPVTTGEQLHRDDGPFDAIREAARVMELPIRQTTVAVVGATGAIGPDVRAASGRGMLDGCCWSGGTSRR